MRAHPPLAHIWTWATLALVYALRRAFETRIAPFLRSLSRGRPADAAIDRFIHDLLSGEALLEKVIRNAAARALGLPIDRRSWRAFVRPMPRNSFRTLIACVRRHERLLRHTERAIYRRIARILCAFATTPLAALRADAAALALRADIQPVFRTIEPAAPAALTPLAARPP